MKETAPIIITFSLLIATAIYSVDNGRGFEVLASFPLQFILPSAVVAAAIVVFALASTILG